MHLQKEIKSVIVSFRATKQQAEIIKSNKKYTAKIREAIMNNLINFEAPGER
jgi:hypothetical protein